MEGGNLPLIGLLHSAAGFCGMCDITSLAFSSDVTQRGSWRSPAALDNRYLKKRDQ